MKPDDDPVSGYCSAVARGKRPRIDEVVRDAIGSEAGPVAHLERAVAALRLSEAAERFARAEVIAARELDGASWTDVGNALGVSRQTAHERFRTGPDGLHSRHFRRAAST